MLQTECVTNRPISMLQNNTSDTHTHMAKVFACPLVATHFAILASGPKQLLVAALGRHAIVSWQQGPREGQWKEGRNNI